MAAATAAALPPGETESSLACAVATTIAAAIQVRTIVIQRIMIVSTGRATGGRKGKRKTGAGKAKEFAKKA